MTNKKILIVALVIIGLIIVGGEKKEISIAQCSIFQCSDFAGEWWVNDDPANPTSCCSATSEGQLDLCVSLGYTSEFLHCNEPGICVDTDGGINYGVKGTAGSNEDVCDGNILHEYYCGAGNSIFVTTHLCEYTCDDGACVAQTCEQPSCSDPSAISCGTEINPNPGCTGTCPSGTFCPTGTECDSGNCVAAGCTSFMYTCSERIIQVDRYLSSEAQCIVDTVNIGNCEIGRSCAKASESLLLEPILYNFDVIESTMCGNCTDSIWDPARITVCEGVPVTQISNCGIERSALGTKNCTGPGNKTDNCNDECAAIVQDCIKQDDGTHKCQVSNLSWILGGLFLLIIVLKSLGKKQ